MEAPSVPCSRRTTLQSLKKIPGIPGLYRHENGSYYGKKKINAVKRVAALTTPDGKNIFTRRGAEEGERGTRSHILGCVHMAMETQVIKQSDRDEFDYVEAAVYAGQDCFPADYEGINGGGLWNVPLTMDPSVGEASLNYYPPELIGVAFYQPAWHCTREGNAWH